MATERPRWPKDEEWIGLGFGMVLVVIGATAIDEGREIVGGVTLIIIGAIAALFVAARLFLTTGADLNEEDDDGD